jgi:hypothetical protein
MLPAAAAIASQVAADLAKLEVLLGDGACIFANFGRAADYFRQVRKAGAQARRRSARPAHRPVSKGQSAALRQIPAFQGIVPWMSKYQWIRADVGRPFPIACLS